MERYITDEHGVRRAVILDIENFKALVRAAEDANDVRAVNEIRRQIDFGEVEMLDYCETREQWRVEPSAERER